MKPDNFQLIENNMPHPLFFLHIPKTAGTTLNNILDDNLSRENILDLYKEEQQQKLNEMTYDQISEYALVRGHVFIGDFGKLLDGPVPFRVFTFLRNPVDRVISEYFFLKTWPKSHLYGYMNKQNVSLTEYVTSTTPQLRQRGRNGMVNSLSGIGGATIEERLELAWYHMKERFVFFGILERFNESLLMLKRTIGLERTFYEKQNVRDKSSNRTATPGELEIIREHNQADIQLYDRALNEFDNRLDAMGPSMKMELRMFDKVNQRLQRVSELVNQKVGLEQGALINSK